MKLKKMLMVLVVLFVFFFGSTGVYAQNAWYNADVESASAGLWYQVVLQNVAPRANPGNNLGKIVGFLPANKEKEMLAVFLTAQSISKKVQVFFDPTTYDPGAGIFPTILTVQIVTK